MGRRYLGTVLKRNFYQRSTVEVAKDLLGKSLVREFKEGNRLVGRIVETEAYCGPEDLACHASHGKTERTKVMFGPPGHAYVYLIYGIHHCLNIVTQKPGAAVLIRALEPVDNRVARRERLGSGPGKLCAWMKIDKSFNGWDLTEGEKLWLEDRGDTEFGIRESPRIGVDYAGRWAQKPWRFFIKGNKFVSKR